MIGDTAWYRWESIGEGGMAPLSTSFDSDLYPQNMQHGLYVAQDTLLGSLEFLRMCNENLGIHMKYQI